MAVAVLSTAGCSSKSDSGTNTNPPSTSDTKSQSSTQTKALPECPTPETMKAELGITYQTPATTSTAKERNCNYFSGEGIAGVHFQILAVASDFNAVKIGMSAGGWTVSDISGLGDQAFSSVLAVSGGSSQNTVGARVGTFVVILTSRASLDKEQAFVAKLLA